MCTGHLFSVAYKEFIESQCALNVHNVHFSMSYTLLHPGKRSVLAVTGRGVIEFPSRPAQQAWLKQGHSLMPGALPDGCESGEAQCQAIARLRRAVRGDASHALCSQ